jgi:NTE family protein
VTGRTRVPAGGPAAATAGTSPDDLGLTKRTRAKAGGIHGLAGPRAEKSVSLALQGGGAHGAFTWGVLDAILEDGRLAIEAVTGASAGAMNAVVMVEGWLEGGADAARAQLETFWRRVSLDGTLSPVQRGLFDQFLAFWSGEAWLDLLARRFSPYEANPLNINPLRDAVAEIIDFERVRACPGVKVYVTATNVWTGKVAVFEGKDLTADHLMASACLPTVFQAVEIDGQPYWDGGYMGNPALFPLFYGTVTDDILLVQINPVERRHTPRTAREIHNRLNEITFNGNLLRELRAIDFVTRLVEAGKLPEAEYKRVLMHRIDGSGVLDDYEAASRMRADWDFFVTLRDAGRATARRWLETNYAAIGRLGTLDLRAEVA